MKSVSVVLAALALCVGMNAMAEGTGTPATATKTAKKMSKGKAEKSCKKEGKKKGTPEYDECVATKTKA